MALWRSISSAFFGVFILVSAISVVIGGIVIMKRDASECGTCGGGRSACGRAVGATKQDILRQFMVESVMQCIAGGALGISLGFWWRWRFGRIRHSRRRSNVGGGAGVFLSSGSDCFSDLSCIARITVGPDRGAEV